MVQKCSFLYRTRAIIKFIYSEKATKFCEIFTLLLSYVVPVKSKVKISKNFAAFSEYMNFKDKYLLLGELQMTIFIYCNFKKLSF